MKVWHYLTMPLRFIVAAIVLGAGQLFALWYEKEILVGLYAELRSYVLNTEQLDN